MTTAQIDFQAVKTAATAEQVIGFLGLKLTQKEDSFRGICPLCKSGSREFVITGSKRLFHCFKCKKGGDLLKLVSETKSIGIRDAAAELAKACGVEAKAPAKTAEVKNFDVEKYAQSLDPSHEALAPLGISPDTLRDWKAGYVSNYQGKGAKLAVPIQGTEGIIAFLGMDINADHPELHVPKHIDPRLYVFGYGMAEGDEIYLTAHPLDVLRAWDSGFHNSVSFLNEAIASTQFQWLVTLMDSAGVKTLSLA
jgi:CHC2 zinc finger